MINEIVIGILDELKSLFDENNVTIVLQNEVRTLNLPSYNLPLVVLGFNGTMENSQMLGGTTRVSWEFIVKCYEYESNPELNPDQDFSINLMEIVDTIRRHFAKQDFQTATMLALIENYSFKMTLGGIGKAENLQIDNGLAFGFEIKFETIAFDNSTNSVFNSDVTLEIVEGDVNFE